MSDEDEVVEDGEEAPKYAFKVLALASIVTHGIGNQFAVVGNVFHAIAGELAAAANYSRYVDELAAEQAQYDEIAANTDWDSLAGLTNHPPLEES